MPLLKHNNQSISNVTSFAQVPAGDMKLLSTATASSSANISFDSTYINEDYKIYKFEFINIHSSASTDFAFNLSTNGGSTYAVTKTTTHFSAYHDEGNTATSLGYRTALDLAQSTAYQPIAEISTNSDDNISGEMYLFNPSSTTYVKHFIVRVNDTYVGYSEDRYTAGYGNTTSAINAIDFKMLSGNIDAGQIKLYGIGAN